MDLSGPNPFAEAIAIDFMRLYNSILVSSVPTSRRMLHENWIGANDLLLRTRSVQLFTRMHTTQIQ